MPSVVAETKSTAAMVVLVALAAESLLSWAMTPSGSRDTGAAEIGIDQPAVGDASSSGSRTVLGGGGIKPRPWQAEHGMPIHGAELIHTHAALHGYSYSPPLLSKVCVFSWSRRAVTRVSVENVEQNDSTYSLYEEQI